MESKIFKSRKKFLENYFKERIVFNMINKENDGFNSSTVYISNTLNYQRYNKDFIKNLKYFTSYYISKNINEEVNLDCIKISMFIPEDIEDESFNNITFYENLLLYEKIRVLKMFNVRKRLFFDLFEKAYQFNIEGNDFILYPMKNFKFFIKGKTSKNDIINLPKCFKFHDCIVCLAKKPTVVFCNCGHIPICTECSKIKEFKECPVCKTLNDIVRIIE